MGEEFTQIAPITFGLTDSSEEDENEEPPPKRRRGEGKDWARTNKFQDSAEALDHVPKDSWYITVTTKTYDGKKVYYRCKHGSGCPA